jgi:hypothetical protein
MAPEPGSGEQINGWLLFFYKVPAQPVSSRMRIWRKLARIGAVQLKGAVYLLPATEEHQEMLQWLVAETLSSGGEAGFARTERIIPFQDAELRELFNKQRGEEYEEILKEIEGFRRKMASFRKGTRPPRPEILHKQFLKIRNEFHSIRKIDFFASPRGRSLEERFTGLEQEITRLLSREKEQATGAAGTLRREDFQGRLWVTRPRPYVDRLASAWLIRRFIDPDASFVFLPEEEIPAAGDNMLSFDVAGGDFTHIDDLCTFETLITRFALTDQALRPLAEIVHDLDLKDDRYSNPAAAGVEAVISGLRDRGLDDQAILDQGLLIFDALHASYAAAAARK